MHAVVIGCMRARPRGCTMRLVACSSMTVDRWNHPEEIAKIDVGRESRGHFAFLAGIGHVRQAQT